MLYPELDFLDRFEAAAQDGFKAVKHLFPNYTCLQQLPATELIAAYIYTACGNGLFDHYFSVSTAMVMRATHVSSPASLVSSICQTCVLRPM